MGLHSWSMRKQFLFLFGLLLLMALGTGWMMWHLSQADLGVISAHQSRYLSYRLADELRQSSDDLTRLARSYVVTGDPKWETQYQTVVRIRAGQAPRPGGYQGIYWDFLAAGLPAPGDKGVAEKAPLLELMKRAGFSDAEFAKLQEAAKNSNELIQTETLAMNLVKGLYDDGQGHFIVKGEPDLERARQLMHGPDYHRYKAHIMAPINEFFVLLDQRTAQAIESAEQHARKWKVIFASFSVLMLLVFAWMLNRIFGHIIRSVTQAVGFAEQVASGDLTARLPPAARNEIGQLLGALARMSQSLSTLVNAVRQGGESIQVASHEVASGNQDMSFRTEKAATRLQETVVSMQQLTEAVNQNAHAARDASELAHEAVAVAQRGGQVVDDAVSTMNGITVASHRISDIIGTIDGIAFQTNILALNAAVEAARAGEQGRGFAVVASEVRMLAHRSAEAAKEIKVLIHESVARIQAGSAQVGASGQTMKEIVTQVQNVSGLIGEISLASQAQSRDIAQIDQAIQALEQATQQNAALVEEMTATSESLRQQAESLQAMVSVFKVDERGMSAPPSSWPTAPALGLSGRTPRPSLPPG